MIAISISKTTDEIIRIAGKDREFIHKLLVDKGVPPAKLRVLNFGSATNFIGLPGVATTFDDLEEVTIRVTG